MVEQYAGLCAEVGFPILDARLSSDASISIEMPPEPVARASAREPKPLPGRRYRSSLLKSLH